MHKARIQEGSGQEEDQTGCRFILTGFCMENISSQFSQTLVCKDLSFCVIESTDEWTKE